MQNLSFKRLICGSLFFVVASLARADVSPSFAYVPSPVTIEHGGNLYASVSVQGTLPMTLVWKRDGIIIPNQTTGTISLINLTQADSGNYTLTATNAAGTATSAPLVLTVNPAKPPIISVQPKNITTEYGGDFTVNVTGTLPFQFQWYRNGVPVAGGVHEDYSSKFGASVPANPNGAVFSVKITNVAGSVTSNEAQLIVLPPAPPVISWPNGRVVHLAASTFGVGYAFNIIPEVEGTSPMSWQWYKDGVAIPGATGMNYAKNNASEADLGQYFVRVTNIAGSAVSDTVTLAASVQLPGWVAAESVGRTVYFLATAPGRILRYDIANEQWLEDVPLAEGKTPTAFWPTANGIFVAYGAEVVWRPGDLTTEVAVTTLDQSVIRMIELGGFVYCREPLGITPIRISDQAVGQTFYTSYTGMTSHSAYHIGVAPGQRYFVDSDSSLQFVRRKIGLDGTLAEGQSFYVGYTFSVGAGMYVTPDEEHIINSAGYVFRLSDAAFIGSVGSGFDRMVFLSGGEPVVLRGRELTVLDPATLVGIGRYAVPELPQDIFPDGQDVIAFSPGPAGGKPFVTRVPREQLTTTHALPPSIASGRRIGVDYSFIDSAGVIHILSASRRELARWNSSTKAYLPSIMLRNEPDFFSYAPSANRLVLAYADGALTELHPGSDFGEKAFAVFPSPNAMQSLVAIDDLVFLNLRDSSASGISAYVVAADGNYRFHSQSYQWPNAMEWHSATRQIYFDTSSSDDHSLETKAMPLDGEIASSFYYSVPLLGVTSGLPRPLRFNADGSRILAGNGRIVTGQLTDVGQIGNQVVDGVWTDDGLFTIRSVPGGTELQGWMLPSHAMAGSRMLPGVPVRVFHNSSAGLVVVTLVNGYPSFHVVPASLSDAQSYHTGPTTGTGPVILQQPQSVLATPGQTITLTAAVVAEPSQFFQWRKNGVELTDVDRIAGAKTLQLTISDAQTGESGVYDLLVTNSAGSVISLPAEVRVSRVASDFNADGKPDLVWQNLKTGERVVWLMNGVLTEEVVGLSSVPVEWTIATSGDFNADGKSDLVWQNLATGDRVIWLLNGVLTNEVVSLGNIPVEWTMATSGDFNADGKSDLVWQNLTTGERTIWLMDGVLTSEVVGLSTVPPEWVIAASGDFNADGKSDLVWQNFTTGERVIWLMNGVLTSEVVSLGEIPSAWAIAGAGDFNQDGWADLLWQNLTTGERKIWLMNGSAIGEVVNLSSVPVEWVLGSATTKPPSATGRKTSDFDGNSRSDILWSNSATGERAMWLMDGASVAGGAVIGTVPVEWEISAVGDYDGDGKADIFWTNNTAGDRAMWLMNGAQMASNAFLSTVPVEWAVSGSGDFNGDGKDDILWTNHATGDRAMWLMDGSNVLGGGFLTTVDIGWQVSGTGDHNGDGKADILWSNTTTGERAMWLMNGIAIVDGAVIGTVPSAWQISGSGDYDGDGKADIFWTNTVTGDRATWLMNGATMVLNTYLGQVPAEWQVSGAGDYNGDGKADVLWTNTATGDRAMWFMNGGIVLGGGYLTSVPLTWKVK